MKRLVPVLFFKKIYLMACMILGIAFAAMTSLQAQNHSIAREWNEILLEGIRGDFARPTVHARNLMHVSAAMYDAWAVYDDVADTYFLGKIVNGFLCPFDSIPVPSDVEAARKEAISYAAYRIIYHRFLFSPGAFETIPLANSKMDALGYDKDFTSTDYSTGSAAALGNYIAEKIIDYGYQDGSNEYYGYRNEHYEPVNEPLEMDSSGNPNLIYPNRWQSLKLSTFIDQSGNPITGVPAFLGPEWGAVAPFALQEEDANIYTRDGYQYKVYHDPGTPPLIGNDGYLPDEYKWGFSMVAVWAAHLDPDDGVMIDISPASIGNNPTFPTSFEDYRNFYDYLEGGDASQGRSVNPKTGQPYAPQIVPRADYARVLAEFWADGPDSETPPGHWFTILNYVNDHPELVKKFKGEGEVLGDLEWDVKSYLMLAGAMHDCAITAWGIKGWYDYVRPVSAIRFMADQGQSSAPNAPNYNPEFGIPLVAGIIEQVQAGDTLAGDNNENVGKIKLFSWKGPDYIPNVDSTYAGVGWILAENWWPYQRPSFVTPPFAGYVSGHSTYSRAAAEVLTMLTGDEYFPGGIGEFPAPKNEFLVFEDGPSVDMTLQWATYRDASDQTSLSRIWGGIHPPADDIPGRLIGEQVGIDAFNKAEKYFEGNIETPSFDAEMTIFPNPITKGNTLLNIAINKEDVTDFDVLVFNAQGQLVINEAKSVTPNLPIFDIELSELPFGVYVIKVVGGDWSSTARVMILKE